MQSIICLKVRYLYRGKVKDVDIQTYGHHLISIKTDQHTAKNIFGIRLDIWYSLEKTASIQNMMPAAFNPISHGVSAPIFFYLFC